MSADRAAGILARFTAAQNALVSKLRDMPPGAAEEQPDDTCWSAAQIGCHVALTNEWIAGVLTGSTPMATPAPAGFVESFKPADVPAKLKTVAPLEPPNPVSRDAALERLRVSGQHVTKAIASLTPERGGGYVVNLPFGTVSLYELADFTAGHVSRHVSQVERAAARA
jgi:hypothetical protein